MFNNFSIDCKYIVVAAPVAILAMMTGLVPEHITLHTWVVAAHLGVNLAMGLVK